MQADSPTHGQRFAWVPTTENRRAYELHLGNARLATLRWESARRHRAVAEAGSEEWTFERQGLVFSRVIVRATGSSAEWGRFIPDVPRSTSGGSLLRSTGPALAWRHTSSPAGEWAWTDSEGQWLVRFTSVQPSAHLRSHVEIAASASLVPDLTLLVLLGWYLIVDGRPQWSAKQASPAAGDAGMGKGMGHLRIVEPARLTPLL